MAWFETIALEEPDKLAMESGSARREAFVCCYDPASGLTWDGVADLESGRLRRWGPVEGMHARIVADEFAAGGEAAKKDQLKARHRLSRFLLRHGRKPEGMQSWTKQFLMD